MLISRQATHKINFQFRYLQKSYQTDLFRNGSAELEEDWTSTRQILGENHVQAEIAIIAKIAGIGSPRQ